MCATALSPCGSFPTPIGVNVTQASETTTTDLPISVVQRPFEPNIEGAVARLHLGSGDVLFCDVLLLTERDLVVNVPAAHAIPDRGETARCSLFLSDDDSFVAHREALVHWEMGVHGQRLAGLFLSTKAPSELLDLTHDDRRREVRFPANLGCVIADNRDRVEGRLVNYSLNGLATQLPTPMTIGSRYTIAVPAGDETIELDGICRWNIETSYGFVNGCSIRPGEGELLARRDFRGSLMGWDINRSRRPAAVPTDSDSETESTGEDSEKPRRQLLSSSTILVLSAVLIGLSVRTPDRLSALTFLGGCVGLLAYIGLSWSSDKRVRRVSKRVRDARRAAAESRLEAHVAGGRSGRKSDESEDETPEENA